MTTIVNSESRAILEFEAQWPNHSAAKERMIRTRFEMSAPRYYRVLAQVAMQPEAVAADPFVTARVRQKGAVRSPLLREFAEHSAERPVTSNGGFELHA